MVTLALQSDEATLSTVRYIFNEVISEFQSTSKRVSIDAGIINGKSFESGLIKIQGRTVALDKFEKYSVCVLKKRIDTFSRYSIWDSLVILFILFIL